MQLPPVETIQVPHGNIGCRAAGAGFPLVLLHGLAGSSKSWEAQFPALADTRRVVAWDCPGYGASDDLPGDEPGIDAYVGAAVAMLDALAFDRVDLLGHSMGGVLAARLAATRPERVRRLILSGTRSGFTRRDPGSFLRRIDELRSLPAAEFGARRAKGMAAPTTGPEIRASLAAVAAEVRLPGFAAAARMLTRADNADLLCTIGVPTLVVAGSADRIALPAEADELEATIFGARRATIADAGHAPYLEQPAAYNAALRAFLGGADIAA